MEARSGWNRRKSYVLFFKLLSQFLSHILIKQHHTIYFSNESKSANTKNTVVIIHWTVQLQNDIQFAHWSTSHITVITDFIRNAANKGIFVQLEVLRNYKKKKNPLYTFLNIHMQDISETEKCRMLHLKVTVLQANYKISYLRIHVFARNVMKQQVHGTW
jgi:hypothetical protein